MNKNEMVWLGMLGCFSYYFYHLFSSKDIMNFIHPKMYKLVFFALIVFVLLTIVQVKKMLFNDGEEKLKKGYIIFLVPIILVLVIQPKSLHSTVVAEGDVDLLAKTTFGASDRDVSGNDEKTVQLSETEERQETMKQTEKEVSQETVKQTEKEVSQETVKQTEKQASQEKVKQTEKQVSQETVKQTEKEVSQETVKQQDIQNSEINDDVAQLQTVDGNLNDEFAAIGIVNESEQYYEVLRMSYEEMSHLIGKEVILTAAIYNNDQLNDNQFYAGRLIITCCAACAQIDGFICESESDLNLENDQWVTLTGVIDVTEQYSEYMQEYLTLPLIRLTKVEKISKPDQPYVYFKW